MHMVHVLLTFVVVILEPILIVVFRIKSLAHHIFIISPWLIKQSGQYQNLSHINRAELIT